MRRIYRDAVVDWNLQRAESCATYAGMRNHKSHKWENKFVVACSFSPCHLFFHLFSSYFISVLPFVSPLLTSSHPRSLVHFPFFYRSTAFQVVCKRSASLRLFSYFLQCFACLSSSSVSLICLTSSSTFSASLSSHFHHARGLLTEAPMCEKIWIFPVFSKSLKLSTANHLFGVLSLFCLQFAW